VLFTVARSLAPVGEGAQPLVRTSDQGWGETDLGMLLRGQPVELDDSDVPGPAVVAVAVERTAEAETGEAAAGDAAASGGARLVVFGDSDFLTDVDIANAGNSVLALNSFNWLGAREELLGIPPREVEQVSLFLNQQQMRTILLLVLVVMPGAAILAGVLVWRKRRH
jgi:ABC-type uncharacterized transport system involved in gliding motility auxiliary subunit